MVEAMARCGCCRRECRGGREVEAIEAWQSIISSVDVRTRAACACAHVNAEYAASPQRSMETNAEANIGEFILISDCNI